MDLYKWLCPATMKRALLCLGFLLGTQMYCLADDELDDDDDSEGEAADIVD